jgi:very-short-patch-repair endonuclease
MKKRNPPGYWTKERVLEDARRFPYQAQWVKGGPKSYSVAKKNGWVQEACKHMTSPKVQMGHWTPDALKSDAQKYLTRAEWKRKSPSAYATACRLDLLGQCCSHMEQVRKPVGYWTEEKRRDSAQRFSTVQSWSLGDPPAYDAAKRGGWVDVVTAHMHQVFSHGEHTIYLFLKQNDIEFVHQKRFDGLKDKAPLPFDFFLPEYDLVIEYHGRQHFETSKSSMFRKELAAIQRRDAIKEEFAKQNGFGYLQVSAQKVDEIEAAVSTRLQEIAASRGWLLQLSRRDLTFEERRKVASLGVWTKDAVLDDARRFSSLTEWSRSGTAALQVAYRNGWVAEATAHMIATQKPKGYWSKDRVLEDAKRFGSKMQWFASSPSAYATAQAKGWLGDATEHMTRPSPAPRYPKGYWTKERVLDDARKYKTPKDWRASSRLAYRHAAEKGWFGEATAHMTGLLSDAEM